MRNEFAVIAEQDGLWHIAYCAEVPGAYGQSATREESQISLGEAITLIFDYRREELLRALPHKAVQEPVVVG